MAQHDKLLAHVDTAFAGYDVVDTVYNGRPARVLFTQERITAQSGLALDDMPELLFDYNERFMELLRGLLPQRILIIGGGAFTLPKAVLAAFADVKLTVVEIDDLLPSIADQYFGFRSTERTRVITADGYSFLRQDDSIYDAIVLDVFSESSIPRQFQTPAFAKLLRRHLSQPGIVAINIIAAYFGVRSAALKRQIEAWQTSFGNLQLFPAAKEPSLWMLQNFILTAQTGTTDLQPYQRYQKLYLPEPISKDAVQ